MLKVLVRPMVCNRDEFHNHQITFDQFREL